MSRPRTAAAVATTMFHFASHSHAEASCALYIHEKAVGRLHQPLELVLGLFQLSWRVEQINITVEHLQV